MTDRPNLSAQARAGLAMFATLSAIIRVLSDEERDLAQELALKLVESAKFDEASTSDDRYVIAGLVRQMFGS